ncbi:MAG: hypothetical protein WCJ67_04295 [Thermoleophilia bacterium]
MDPGSVGLESVLDPQARNLFEAADVAGDEGGGVGEVNCSDSAVDIDESLSSTFEVVSETSVDDLSHEDRGSALVDGRETGEAV